MPSDRTMLTVRLTEEIRDQLDAAAKRTRRSRGSIVKEALQRQLSALEKPDPEEVRLRRIAELMKFSSAGTRLHGGRSVREIDNELNQFRGDE